MVQWEADLAFKVDGKREALSGTRTSKTRTAGVASKAKQSAKKAKKPIRGRRK
jgi:hypothetical protein